jgi:hypothetical protein
MPLGPVAGVNQILYFGTGTASPVSEGTGFTMNTSTQFADDTSWGDVFQTQRPTIIQATCQVMKHYDHSETALAAARDARALGKFYWYPDRSQTGDYIYWTGYVSGGAPQAGSLTGMISATFDIVFATQPTWVRS